MSRGEKPIHAAKSADVSPCGADEQLTASFPDSATSLTISHLWLADAVARRFQGRGQDLDDLRQIARCGLLEAARRYDPSHGAFAPYATSTISGVIKRHFRDHAWTVRPPRRTQELALQISLHWSDAAQECQRQPTDTSLATTMGESVDDIREARSASRGYNAISIDADIFPAAATAAFDPGYDRCEAQILVAQAWRLLEPSERELLRLRFWENCSQTAIADKIGVSQMQVSRLLTKTFLRIRQVLNLDDTQATA